MFKINRKASSLVEYALVLGVVSLALTGMNFYLKRGIQARVKDMTVNLIVQDLFPGGGHQYVSGQFKSDSTTAVDLTTNQQVQGHNTTTITTEDTTRIGTEYSVGEGFEDLLPE